MSTAYGNKLSNFKWVVVLLLHPTAVACGLKLLCGKLKTSDLGRFSFIFIVSL